MEVSPGGGSRAAAAAPRTRPSRKAGAVAAAVGALLLAVVVGAMVAVFRTAGTAGEVLVSVAASFVVRTAKWPVPGATLPVMVDRAQPQRFEVQWDQVGTSHQLALRQAEQIAARMRAATDSTTPTLGFEAVRGMPVLPAGDLTIPELRAALRQDGAPGRAVIDQVRPGGQIADGQEFHLDVWLQMDSGVSMRQEQVPVAVPADQVAKVVPGRIVPVRVGVVEDVLVTAYQWELV